MTKAALPHTPKGLPPIPGQRAIDEQMLAMIVALASQATVTRARLDACERVLIANNLIAPDAIDTFEPDADAARARDAMRTSGLNKIFRALQEAGAADLAKIAGTPPKEDAA